MFFEKIHEWFRYSKKKQDYSDRIADLDNQLDEIADMRGLLIDEANRLMTIYRVSIRLTCMTPKGVAPVLVWNLTDFKREIKVKSRKSTNVYSVRVRDFSRMRIDEREQFIELLKTKDNTFWVEFSALEKKRLSVNLATRTITNMISQIEQLSKNDFELKHIIEDLTL